MSDRDCDNCLHHTENGCSSWECEFLPRTERTEVEAKITKKIKEIVELIKDYDESIDYFSICLWADEDFVDFHSVEEAGQKKPRINYTGGFN